jgi:hypothetical protein
MVVVLIIAIILTGLYNAVVLDMLIHHDSRHRDRYILRVLQARKTMFDEYMIGDLEPKPVEIETYEGTVHPRRVLSAQKNEEHEAWIADLTEERALYDLYSAETVMIPLPADEVIS